VDFIITINCVSAIVRVINTINCASATANFNVSNYKTIHLCRVSLNPRTMDLQTRVLTCAMQTCLPLSPSYHPVLPETETILLGSLLFGRLRDSLGLNLRPGTGGEISVSTFLRRAQEGPCWLHVGLKCVCWPFMGLQSMYVFCFVFREASS
jgi:hypothetical protein